VLSLISVFHVVLLRRNDKKAVLPQGNRAIPKLFSSVK